MKKTAGFFLCIFIASAAFYISQLHPAFDALVISIITGILIGSFLTKNENMDEGIALALKFFLPLGISLYGSQLMLKGHPFVWLQAIIPLVLLFSFTLFLSKIMKIPGNIGILLATGISICGASAVAIVSPLIRAKKDETSIAIISVMMVGLIGMVFYPVLRNLLNFSPEGYALWVGATLPMIGQVQVAAGPDLTPPLRLSQ